jgi:ribosome biogenesis GTPase A
MLRSLISSIKSRNEDLIERKAIDVSGRLGSLYDASTDNLIYHESIEASEIKIPRQHTICRILSNHQSNEITNYLKQMDFNDALRQSLLLRMVEPSGVSRLIDYDQSINEKTRLLYYSYRSRKEKLDVKTKRTHRILSRRPDQTAEMHFISKILWGIEILFIVQIPSNLSDDAVDDLLQHICNLLKGDDAPITFDEDMTSLIEQLNVTLLGSEKCLDEQNRSMLTTLTEIRKWIADKNLHHPLMYTMQSLVGSDDNDKSSKFDFSSKNTDPYIAQIEPILICLKNQMDNLPIFQQYQINFPSQTLQQRLRDFQEEYRSLGDKRQHQQERLRNVLADVRRGRIGSEAIHTIISDQSYQCLDKTEIQTLHVNAQRLIDKAKFIEKLRNDRIQYINVMDIVSQSEEIDALLKRTFSNENALEILWYSTDRLKREKAERFEEIYQQLISEQQQATERIHLIYADFSQKNQKLEDFFIIRLPKIRLNPPSLPYPPPPIMLTEMNVLLLGETGVGKSTFINAFANYLRYDTLQQAEQNEPIALIPVSFLTTVAGHSDEFKVKFGSVDSNEIHEHQGQSVTQQCKSYIFHLNDRVCVRFIDTPGAVQDGKYMDHILSYVNNLSHLNAICFLLQSNTSQLNVLLNSCIKQLLTYLTPNGYSNIIFCFTNAAPTFYTPGETTRLLSQMLKNEYLHDIPFHRENIFCFDSELFRYLVARKCSVTFDNNQSENFIRSWSLSVTESLRLISFIRTRIPYYLHIGGPQVTRQIALDISLFARPLMEALRLMIYNWKLSEINLNGCQIVLNSVPVRIEMCTHCAQIHIVQKGPVWIAQYQPLPLTTNANQHHLCPLDGQHFLIENIVYHDFVVKPTDLQTEQYPNLFRSFLLKCDRILHFLGQQGLLVNADPFEPILERFLQEEQEILQMDNINPDINRKTHEILQSIQEIRQENRQQLVESNERLLSRQVYQMIIDLTNTQAVRHQIDTIRTSRHTKMVENERRIPMNFIQNRFFSEFFKFF